MHPFRNFAFVESTQPVSTAPKKTTCFKRWLVVEEMVLGQAIFRVLKARPISCRELQRLTRLLKKAEFRSHCSWVGTSTGQVPFPFTDYKSIVLIVSLIHQLDRWCAWITPQTQNRYYQCRVIDDKGERVAITWAAILVALDDTVRREGFSNDPHATFENLALAVLYLRYWGGGKARYRQTHADLNGLRFIRMVSLALEAPSPPSLEPQPGEGSGEPQPGEEDAADGAVTAGTDASGIRNHMAGVQMNTETVRGVKRYRLRETYERERARCKRVRDLHGLRSTPAREQRLSEWKEKPKRNR